ncbi:MAG TPA: hypothetical protein VNF50_09765 [Acidimicrobiales bacterium]|nr:hypothetical protein [Acidimicrobiales bacterium]
MIEIRVFSLKAGVSEADFRAADVRVQTELVPFQAGFIRRTTARGEESDSWLVLTLWASGELASAASQATKADPAGAAFNALIDPATERVARFHELGG